MWKGSVRSVVWGAWGQTDNDAARAALARFWLAHQLRTEDAVALVEVLPDRPAPPAAAGSSAPAIRCPRPAPSLARVAAP